MPIRPVLRKDLPAVHALVRAAGLHAESDTAHWVREKEAAWFDSPARAAALAADGDSAPPGHVLENENGLVGFVGYTYRDFILQGKRLGAVVPVEYSVHPDHRGMAGLLLNKATLETFHGRRLVVAMHHTDAAGKIWKRFGAREVPGTNSVLSAVVNPANLLPRFLNPLGLTGALTSRGPARAVLDALVRRHGDAPVNTAGWRCHKASPVDISAAGIEAEHLCQIFASQYDTGVVRDHAYLCWRYGDTRRHRWFVMQDHAPMALFCLSLAGSTVYLSECLFDAQRLESMELMRTIFHTAAGIGGRLLLKPSPACLGDSALRLGARERLKTYNQFWIHPAYEGEVRPLFTMGDYKEL